MAARLPTDALEKYSALRPISQGENSLASRLLLRDFTPHDVEAVHAFDSDPELARYRGGGKVRCEA